MLAVLAYVFHRSDLYVSGGPRPKGSELVQYLVMKKVCM